MINFVVYKMGNFVKNAYHSFPERKAMSSDHLLAWRTKRSSKSSHFSVWNQQMFLYFCLNYPFIIGLVVSQYLYLIDQLANIYTFTSVYHLCKNSLQVFFFFFFLQETAKQRLWGLYIFLNSILGTYWAVLVIQYNGGSQASALNSGNRVRSLAICGVVYRRRT